MGCLAVQYGAASLLHFEVKRDAWLGRRIVDLQQLIFVPIPCRLCHAVCSAQTIPTKESGAVCTQTTLSLAGAVLRPAVMPDLTKSLVFVEVEATPIPNL